MPGVSYLPGTHMQYACVDGLAKAYLRMCDEQEYGMLIVAGDVLEAIEVTQANIHLSLCTHLFVPLQMRASTYSTLYCTYRTYKERAFANSRNYVLYTQGKATALASPTKL